MKLYITTTQGVEVWVTYDVKLLLLHVICELFQQPKSKTEVPLKSHSKIFILLFSKHSILARNSNTWKITETYTKMGDLKILTHFSNVHRERFKKRSKEEFIGCLPCCLHLQGSQRTSGGGQVTLFVCCENLLKIRIFALEFGWTPMCHMHIPWQCFGG